MPCDIVVSCGISTSFPVLFPSKRKVAHALLTRPPLKQFEASSKLSPLDLHVLGTPPAFVLSQDQTLAFNPLSLTGLPGQVQLIRNYCLLFALFLFCIVFKVQCSPSGLWPRESACIEYQRSAEMSTPFQHFFQLFLKFSRFPNGHFPVLEIIPNQAYIGVFILPDHSPFLQVLPAQSAFFSCHRCPAMLQYHHHTHGGFPMMRKNDLLTLTAERLGADLEGVCRHEGMAVFVPGLLPGETTTVRIVKVEKRYAFGRMEGRPETPSSQRHTPDCPAYPRCGGCSGRHMSYEATLEAKRLQVQDCFERIGKLSVEVPPVLGMADPSAYRNKTALPVGGTPDAPCVGFYAPRSHAIIPIDRCPNAMPPADALCREVLGWMKAHHVTIYNEETHSGLMRHVVIRVNRKHEAMVTLVVNGTSIPDPKGLWNRLSAHGAVSLILSENRERTNVIQARNAWKDERFGKMALPFRHNERKRQNPFCR